MEKSLMQKGVEGQTFRPFDIQVPYLIFFYGHYALDRDDAGGEVDDAKSTEGRTKKRPHCGE